MSPREDQIRNELLEDVPGYDYAVHVEDYEARALVTVFSQGRVVATVPLEGLLYSDPEGRAACVREELGKQVPGSA